MWSVVEFSPVRSAFSSLFPALQLSLCSPLLASGCTSPNSERNYSVVHKPQMANQLSGCGAEYTRCSCRLHREEELNLWGISYPLNKLPENQKGIIPFSQNQRMSSKPTEEEDTSITQSQLSASQLSMRSFEDELRGFPHLSTPLVPQDARRTVNVSHFYANKRELHRPTSDIETLLCSFSALRTNAPSQNAHGALLYRPVNFSYTDPDEILTRSDVPPAVPLQSQYNSRRANRPSTMRMQSTEETLVPNGTSSSSIPLQSEVRTSSSVSSDETEHLSLVKTGLYKTELCRSWEETGNCRYSTKCQVLLTIELNKFITHSYFL